MTDIAQRDAFWNRIYELARTDPSLVIVSADMGAPALDRIRRDLAAQFVNVGIAEQNAITLASGLALAGKRVLTYSIAPFITLRCLEQIRVENAMMKIPITIVGVGAGFGYEDSGPTHHLIEDLAVMRSMPNLTIYSVSDAVMAAACADRAVRQDHASYVRLDRQALPPLYDATTDFTAGLQVLRRGAGPMIAATGCMVHTALAVARELEGAGLQVGVIDVHALPINPERLLAALTGCTRLVTLEEHFLAGGLGSAIGEILIDRQQTIPVKRLGLPMDRAYCYEYGGREAIRRYYGLDGPSVSAAVRAFCG